MGHIIILLLLLLLLLGERSEPHTGVFNWDFAWYIYLCLSYVKSRGITWIKHAHAQSQYWAVKSDQWHPYYSFRLYARAALAWTEEKRSLRNEKLKANKAS